MERSVIDRLRQYAGKDHNQVVNPNITAREAIQIADYLVLMERAAHRWEALINCARIRPLGSAGLSRQSHDPNGVEFSNRAHLGLELWTVHSDHPSLAGERKTGVEWLTKFADKAILANKEKDDAFQHQ